LHDARFDEMHVSSVVWEENSSSRSSDEATAVNETSTMDDEICSDYKVLLHLYPTDPMKKSFISSNPAIYTVFVLALFGLSIVLFILYDAIITLRQKKVEEAAKQTDAIVTQLFPGQLRDMVIDAGVTADTSDSNEQDEAAKPNKVTAASSGLFMEGTKAMADFYPEVTVMMADLVGFLSWSSTHEPAQVFELLEAIFHGFDKIARRRGVFKVM
jgi:Adenylate and Guanylate cyclase catalytic domain